MRSSQGGNMLESVIDFIDTYEKTEQEKELENEQKEWALISILSTLDDKEFVPIHYENFANWQVSTKFKDQK